MADQATAQNTSGQAAANTSAASTAAQHDASRQQSTHTDQTQAPNADRPAYVPESFWDAEKKSVNVEGMSARLKELSDASEAEAKRRETLPKAAGDYKVALPDDFKLPEGVEIDLQNPAWPAFAEFAHTHGLSQDDFAQGAKLITQMQLAAQDKWNKSVADYAAAEQAKLGDNAKARIEALHKFVDANASPDDAKAIKGSISTAALAQFLEKTISVLSSNGITAFNGNGRDQGRTDGKPNNWEQMSDVDRLAWARAQETQRNNGAARR